MVLKLKKLLQYDLLVTCSLQTIFNISSLKYIEKVNIYSFGLSTLFCKLKSNFTHRWIRKGSKIKFWFHYLRC